MERWKIDENETLPLAVIVDDENGEGVCEIGIPGTESATECPENWRRAHIIAAAPELIAALEGLIAWGALARLIDKGIAESIAKDPVWKIARAALDKAKAND